jgi:hypothetical protein
MIIPDSVKKFGSKLGGFLKHPLVIAVLAGAFTALLIPQLTRVWQDRQREDAIKESLLQDISSSSTTAVRQAISLTQGKTRAAGGEAGEDVSDTYAVLRNSWLIKRASARSRIIVYFPNLYSCWYSYERAVADYLSLSASGTAKTGKKAKAQRDQRKAWVKQLRRYADANFAKTYMTPQVPDGCSPMSDLPEVVQTRLQDLKRATGWAALTYPTDHPRFKNAYAILGEAMIIAMERIITSIESSHAKGFSHGVI